uniref:Protein regulator of cytokinesis 1 n=1 Tax=Neogobius melanostomus TaxID=47308 RepID=A0A8C6TX76_9GOBI
MSEMLAAEAVSCLNKALILLKDVWEQIGIPEPQRLERTRTVKKHIQGLLEMMIAEEESLRCRLEKSVESSREEAQTLLQADEELRGALEELQREKARRMETLQNLLQQEEELVTILGTPRLNIDQTRPPSAQQLDELRQHLANQREEQLQFQTLREQILVLFSDLDHSPDSDLEKHLLLLEAERLEEMKLSELSCCLLVYSGCLLVYSGCLQWLFTCLQLLLEAERLEQMKLSELRSVSDRVRGEISEFWDKCFYSEEQRLSLSVFYTDEVSEQVLEALEAELQCLKQFYEGHRPIMEAVQKWMDQWELFLELERKASDPSRFTNRGGNLLKEERQRSELSKSLPRSLERVLKEQISLWEQTQRSPFLVKGLNFLQFVEQQWDLLQQQKDRRRTSGYFYFYYSYCYCRGDMMYGTTVRTPTKRRFIGTSSSCSPRGAPSRAPRRTRVSRSPGPRPPSCGSSVRTKASQPRGPALTQDQVWTQEQKENRPQAPPESQSPGSVASTYSQFLVSLI